MFGSVFRLVADSPLIGHPVHNLIVSNVPGPQAQLYFLRCQVEAMYPLGPLFHGCGLNVTAMSLNGKLNVGVICARNCCPTCGGWSTTSTLRSRSCLNARVRRAADEALPMKPPRMAPRE